MGDLEFDLSSSPKVKSNGAVGLPIYYSHSKIFSYLLSLGPNFDPPPPPPPPPQAHPYPRTIFFKIESLHPWVQGEPPIENAVDR